MLWRAIQLASVKAIFLARTLILARLLVPEDFGLLAVSLIAVDVFVSITDFGLVPALVQRAEAGEHHYHAAWTAGLLRAVAIAVFLLLTAPGIASLLSEPRAAGLLRVVALRPVLEAAGSAKVAEVTRLLRFRTLALMSVPEAVVNAAVSIALARPLGVWALVAGTLAGPAVSGLMSYRLAPYRPRLAFHAAAVWPLLQFGRWIFLTGLISVVGRALLQIVIAQKLGVEALGLYYLAAKLALVPAEVSSEVVGAVAFPMVARLQADAQQIVRAFRAIFTGVAALLFPPCALLVVLAPSLVTAVLAQRWHGVAPLSQLLALVNIVGLFGDTVGPILKGMGRPDRLAALELIQSSVLIFGIWALADRFGVVGAALAWLAAVGASQLVSALLIREALPTSIAGLTRPALGIAAASGVGALVAASVVALSANPVGLLAAGVLGLVASAALLWAADRVFAFGLSSGVARAFPRAAAFASHSPPDGPWR